LEIYVQQQEEHIRKSKTHHGLWYNKKDAVEHIWLRGNPAECSRKHLNISENSRLFKKTKRRI
jgi:hypothetical protein